MNPASHYVPRIGYKALIEEEKVVKNNLEIKLPYKKQDLHVANSLQYGTHMGGPLEKVFHWAMMVESMSSSRRNYKPYHRGMSIYQGGMERGGKDGRDKECLGK